MHQALHISEILLNILGHCCTRATLLLGRHSQDKDLAALARTCTAFKEPALDVLWEELLDLTPLVRCLPETWRVDDGVHPQLPQRFNFRLNVPCYSFNRPLKEVDWKILRGYTRRVRFICCLDNRGYLLEATIKEIFSLAQFDEPLFPHLQALYWCDYASFAPLHAAVPSLTFLHLKFDYLARQPVTEFFDAFGDRSPNIKRFNIEIGLVGILDSTISRQICRWTKLQAVSCQNISLSADVILHLSSMVDLMQLSFTAEIDAIQEILHFGSVLVFPSLEDLVIRSRSLQTITSLLSCTRLPAIKSLSHIILDHISRRAIQTYWAAAREACPSVVSIRLDNTFFGRNDDPIPPDEDMHLMLGLEDLRPWTAFSGLRRVYINLKYWDVKLTDVDLLELVSPRMVEVFVNSRIVFRRHH